MKPLPRFDRDDAQQSDDVDSIALAVYAPFGSDPTLSQYPGSKPRAVEQHPLVRSLAKVAALGVHVHALIDLVDDFSYVVEFDAWQTKPRILLSAWKQDMASPYALAGFLLHVRRHRQCSSLVLALEGHGAGYLPDIDRAQLTTARVTDDGGFEWHTKSSGSSPVLPTGSPVLPTGSPVLPTGSPVLPAGTLPLSTFGLGEALQMATEKSKHPLAVIHFNNCFNMSVEVLDTAAPYAAFATGYCNYNFFTSGETYPAAFRRWITSGPRTALGLAQWFAKANEKKLKDKGHHPTIGSVVALAQMPSVTAAVDRLARELTKELDIADQNARLQVRNKIEAAIRDAQQYDTVPLPTTKSIWTLDVPDQLTDLASFASALMQQFAAGTRAHLRADALLTALKDVKVYGDTDSPWMDLGVTWDFSSDALAMNIFLPDPALEGIWDWRSPYYLERQGPTGKPPIQPGVIRFLRQTRWIEFLIEYHKQVPFVALLPALAPQYPIFNAKFNPDGGPGQTGGPYNQGPGPSDPTGNGDCDPED
jgi:Clostripain family